MNDLFLVRRFDRLADLDTDLENVRKPQRALAQLVLKRHAIDILHGNERFAVDFSDFVDLADVGVVERGGGACLSKKTLASRFVFLKSFGQEFEGDVAVQRAVLGKEHFTSSR